MQKNKIIKNAKKKKLKKKIFFKSIENKLDIVFIKILIKYESIVGQQILEYTANNGEFGK